MPCTRTIWLFLCLSAAVAAQTMPAADECATAADALVAGINPAPGASGVTYSVAGATTSASSTCVSLNRDVWFTYVAATSAVVRFSTCTPAGFAAGSMSDSVMALYDACGGTQIACNDTSPCGTRAELTAALVGGVSYRLRVGEYGTITPSATTFYVTVTVLPADAYDECAGAATLLPGAGTALSTGVTSGTEPSACGPFVNDVWFAYTAATTETVTFSAGSGQILGGAMAVYDGCGGAELACRIAPFQLSGANFPVRVSVPVVAGSTYYGRLGVLGPVNYGGFSVTVLPTPANDECANAIPITIGTTATYSNSGATNDAGATPTCPLLNAMWFVYQPTCSGTCTVTTSCTLDFYLSAHSVCGGPPIACARNNIFCDYYSSFMAQITFPVVAGGDYRIAVGSPHQFQTGTFNLTVQSSAGFALSLSSPLGAGSLQANLDHGGQSGAYLLAATTAPGIFPHGWFGGLDIPFNDLMAQIVFGYPFVGSTGPCGEAMIGPVTSLPSGVTLYFGAVALDGATGAVAGIAAPKAFTIP